MYINSVASCCGIGDISELDDYQGAGKSAMLDFCEQLADFGGEWDYTTNSYKKNDNMRLHFEYGHYTFTGVINHGHTYVQSFRSYIKRNRLGSVVSTRGRSNPNHPGNQVVCCVWTPNKTNLSRWYKKNVNNQ